jgi:hypothetical protein
MSSVVNKNRKNIDLDCQEDELALKKLTNKVAKDFMVGESNEQMVFLDVLLRRYLLHSIFFEKAESKRPAWRQMEGYKDFVKLGVD